MSTPRNSRGRSRSGADRGTIRRRILAGAGVVGAGLAAVAVALTLAGALDAGASADAQRSGAPAVAFATIDGREVALADLRGHPVAFYFMASWCATCVPEAQAWGSIARDATVPGLEVFVVDVDPSSNTQALATFRDRYVGPGLHWVFDGDQTLTRAFSVASLDTTVLIDSAGQIASRSTVPLSVDQLRAALAGL